MLSTCRNVARFQHDFKFDGFEDGTLQRKARRSTWHKSNAHVCSHFGVTPLLCSLLLNSKFTREHGTLILHEPSAEETSRLILLLEDGQKCHSLRKADYVPYGRMLSHHLGAFPDLSRKSCLLSSLGVRLQFHERYARLVEQSVIGSKRTAVTLRVQFDCVVSLP